MNNKILFSSIGYKYLAEMLENYDYKFLFNDARLYLSAKKPYKIKVFLDGKEELKPYNGKVPTNIFEHIEFALKHEDINLSLLKVLFVHISNNKDLLKDLEKEIKTKSTGKTERKIWFLYEFLIGNKLNISDLGKRNYIDLLDEEQYFTATPVKSQRHAVNNNFLNPDANFCPVVRKTKKLQEFVQRNFGKEISETILSYQDKLHLVYKAINYLYVSETRGTYGIERLTPTQSRQAAFIRILEDQSKNPMFATKNSLIKLQNKFVEPRYKDDNYRKSQIYVGSSRLSASLNEYVDVDFVGARPQDVENLMSEFFKCYSNLLDENVNAVIASAILSFAFVYIHPFSDGNGRISRYLIHNVLSLKQIMPAGMIFPVSAYMLKNIASYYDVLNVFSKKFMSLVDYEIYDSEMQVSTETKELYRFIDFTKHAEYLFECIDNTLKEDFTAELRYLENYEKTRVLAKEVVDLPDVKLNNFIQFMKQNNNKLPNKRRSKNFAELTDKEIEKLEQVINENLLNIPSAIKNQSITLDGIKVLAILEKLNLTKDYDFVKNDATLTEAIRNFYPQYKNSDNLINLIKRALQILTKSQI